MYLKYPFSLWVKCY